MNDAACHADEQRVLIVAPFGRDADLAAQTLQRLGFSAHAVASIDRLIEEIRGGVGAIMIAAEALDPRSMKRLTDDMASQPPWSDIPIIILTSDTTPQSLPSSAAPPFEDIGNVTFLPRPFSVRTIVSIVRFALRSRSRQYTMRGLIRQLDERTSELTRSNAEFQTFAYTAAHDMREPIRAIESYLGIVTERFGAELPAAGMRYIANATSAAVRMRTLLQALLAYAHVGNNDLMATAVSLKAVAIAAIKNLAEPIARCAGEVTITGDDHIVHGDEALLIQLFQNLIGNGLKFQKPGAIPRIEVSWTVDDGHWTCSVRDNGIGIPPEAQERVFAIFQRLHAVGEYPGSGIGLATCRRIVDRHAGRIWVESEVGVGSTFRFAVPLGKAPADRHGTVIEGADRDLVPHPG